jgi:hypothetical protein
MIDTVDCDKQQLVVPVVLVDKVSIVKPSFDKHPEGLIQMEVEHLYQVLVMLK